MKYLVLFTLFLIPAVILTLDNGSTLRAYATEEEDPIEDDIEVEGETEDVTTTTYKKGENEEDEDEEDSKSTASPDADTTLLFVKPVSSASQLEFPAGIPVEFLVGFRNTGEQDFTLDTLEASFRYPMDFNFYIQNFSAISYNKVVATAQEATLAYSFVPSEAFSGRPFGLAINLAYHDAAGNHFTEAVYNETVQIVELDQGLDGETFFLYILLIAGAVLLLVIGQQTLLSFGKKRITRKTTPVETGTDNPNNVDYDWLPKQTLASLNKEKLSKSPKPGKHQSPRQRKTKKAE